MLALAGLASLVLSVDGCSGGVRPYRAMVKAARSELSPVALARDQRLKLQLREAILVDQTFAGLSISPHVYMERGFVVGLVDSVEQAERYSTRGKDRTGASESERSSTGTEKSS